LSIIVVERKKKNKKNRRCKMEKYIGIKNKNHAAKRLSAYNKWFKNLK